MKNKTLLILAAGMGSRFGGLKQVEPFGPNGEFIIDYSIYDAIKNGFNKVVFIIKEENYDLFRETVGKRIEKYVKTEYVFQNLNNVPNNYKIPENRVKPLGTAHAVLCAKNVINEPFIMINSDDFYGRDAFKVASDYIDNNNDTAVVGYHVINTLTENGSVKRGVLKEKDGYLVEIDESSIINNNGIIEATSLSSGNKRTIDKNAKVSMNMIIFQKSIFDYIEKKFVDFLENNDLEKDEYLIPDIISDAINEENYKVRVLDTDSVWAGVTYKEDKDSVVKYINTLIKDGIYEKNLWK